MNRFAELFEEASGIVRQDYGDRDDVLREAKLDPAEVEDWFTDDALDTMRNFNVGDPVVLGSCLCTHAHQGFVVGYLLGRGRITP